MVWNGKRKVCSRLKDALYKYVHHLNIMGRWRKQSIQIEDMEKVTWEANTEAMKEIPLH